MPNGQRPQFRRLGKARNELLLVVADDHVVGPNRNAASFKRFYSSVAGSRKLDEGFFDDFCRVFGRLALLARDEDGHVIGRAELPELGVVVAAVGQSAIGFENGVVIRRSTSS